MMKKLKKFVFLLSAISMLINRSQVNAAKLKCKYIPNSSYFEENLSYCNVANKEIFDGSRVTIDSVEVTNLGSSTNDNVQGINIDNFPSVNYFPKDIDKFFKNIKVIRIHSSNLQEITATDLKPFPQLKYLYLHENKIKTVEPNLFQYNPNLRRISLQKNLISHIDPNVFDHLTNLDNLYLNNNKCKKELSGFPGTRSAVLEFIKRIKNGDCSDDEVMRKQNEAKLAAIKSSTQLQAVNQEFSAKYENLQQNFTSVVNEKSTLTSNFNKLQEKYEKLENDQQVNDESIRKLKEKLSISEEQTKVCEKTTSEIKMENQGFLRQLNELNGSLGKCNQPINDLNNEIKVLSQKLIEMHVKYENLLSDKLIEANEKIKKIVGDEKKDNECVTLFFGAGQNPTIMVS